MQAGTVVRNATTGQRMQVDTVYDNGMVACVWSDESGTQYRVLFDQSQLTIGE